MKRKRSFVWFELYQVMEIKTNQRKTWWINVHSFAALKEGEDNIKRERWRVTTRSIVLTVLKTTEIGIL